MGPFHERFSRLERLPASHAIRTVLLLVAGASLVATLGVAACGLDVGGALRVGDDASSGVDAPAIDATVDATVDANGGAPGIDAADGSRASADPEGGGVDAGDGAPVADDGAPSGDGSDDAGCDGALSCNGRCVTSCNDPSCDAGLTVFTCGPASVCGNCNSCDAGTVECFQCGDAGTSSCESSGALCPTTLLCTCDSGAPSDCPGAQQACIKDGAKFICKSCGMAGPGPDTAGTTCQNGGLCQKALSLCQ